MKRKNDNETPPAKKKSNIIQRTATHEKDHEDNNPNNYPKRKVAVVFGYNGKNYSGSQRNCSVVTIESVLENAIADAGGISGLNRGSFSKIGWSSTCRTDKGVSAVGNVVSFKALMIPEFLPSVNALLPDDIRVFKILRVTNGFNGRKHCSGRIYQYIIPTFLFDNTYIPTEETVDVIPQYRIDNEKLEFLAATMQRYIGTHNFHNYTKKGDWNLESSKRYMTETNVSQPFMMNEIEWVNITIQGQSFMYNQIRKMVGMAMFIVRDNADNETIVNCFYKPKKNLPLAPALGLFLNRITWEAFNSKPNPHGQIEFDETELAAMDEFMSKRIIEELTESEKDEATFRRWLMKKLENPIDYVNLNRFMDAPVESTPVEVIPVEAAPVEVTPVETSIENTTD